MSTPKKPSKTARREKLERCKNCCGSGQVISWISDLEDTDWIACPFCHGDGFVKQGTQ